MKKLILLLATLNVCVFIVTYIACNKPKADPCSGITCQNGGTCSGGTCTCPTGYSGANCEICNLACTPSCPAHSTCNCGACSCDHGYEGPSCNPWTSKIVGTGSWHQSDSCASTGSWSGGFSTTVTAIDATHFSINNIDNVGTSINVICRITSSTPTSATFKVDSLSGGTSSYYIWWGDPKFKHQTASNYGVGSYFKKNGSYRMSLAVFVRQFSQPSPDTCFVSLY